jgi:hypothetical protein
MEAKLQEAINKLPVIQKVHIYEPKIEDVAEISYKVGYEQAKKEDFMTTNDIISDLENTGSREWYHSSPSKPTRPNPGRPV